MALQIYLQAQEVCCKWNFYTATKQVMAHQETTTKKYKSTWSRGSHLFLFIPVMGVSTQYYDSHYMIFDFVN